MTFRELIGAIFDAEAPAMIAEAVEYYLTENDDMNDFVDTFGRIISTDECRVKNCKDEIDRLKHRNEQAKERIEIYKSALIAALDATGKKKHAANKWTATKVKGRASVADANLDELPEEFKVEIPATFRADKKAIMNHFKTTGEIVEGAVIDIDGKPTLKLK